MDPNFNNKDIKVIELHMMDQSKYYPLALVSGFTIRSFLYPVTLIRTRLQVQKQRDVYKGLIDAFCKIVKNEGVVGLYRGFWVSSLMTVSQITYITTYENVRHYMKKHTRFTDKKIRSFVSGGCASLAAQTFVVPVDIVSQHLQMQGLKSYQQQSNEIKDVKKSRMAASIDIVQRVYKQNGIKGFYRGYIPSITLYGTQSASWWVFYDVYCDLLGGVAPAWVPRLLLQALAAPCGGVTTCLLTNPLDVVRARVQVENSNVMVTAKTLWQEEGISMFVKGVTARMTQSVMFSVCIIVGYETIKRWSVLEEYKDHVRW